MKQKIIHKRIFLIVIAIILLNSMVTAFAVSSKYYDGNPLYMQPGETTDTFFTLQNLAGTKDVTIKSGITSGADIIELTDSSEIYDIPLGEKTKVNFKITAPSDAKKGDTFPISIEFTTLTSSGEGPVALGSSIGKGFNVIIGEAADFREEPEELPETKISTGILYTIIGIIVLIIIIFLVLRKRK